MAMAMVAIPVFCQCSIKCYLNQMITDHRTKHSQETKICLANKVHFRSSSKTKNNCRWYLSKFGGKLWETIWLQISKSLAWNFGLRGCSKVQQTCDLEQTWMAGITAQVSSTSCHHKLCQNNGKLWKFQYESPNPE